MPGVKDASLPYPYPLGMAAIGLLTNFQWHNLPEPRGLLLRQKGQPHHCDSEEHLLNKGASGRCRFLSYQLKQNGDLSDVFTMESPTAAFPRLCGYPGDLAERQILTQQVWGAGLDSVLSSMQ